MHDTLKQSIDLWVKNAPNDWDFVVVISGSGTVRVGKCQTKGSRVLMHDGSWKNVEDIKLGDRVISPNIKTGKQEIATVKNLHSRYEEDCYDIVEAANRTKLYSCAGNHDVPIEYVRNIRKNMPDGRRKITGYRTIRKTMEAQELSTMKEVWYKNKSVGTHQGFLVENFVGQKNPKIDAYCLGYFLGDGSFCSIKKKVKNIDYGNDLIIPAYKKTMKSGKEVVVKSSKREIQRQEYHNHYHRSVAITSETIESMKYICDCYSPIRIGKKSNTAAKDYHFSLSGKFCKELTLLGLEGKGSGTKFIPDAVKKADADYRFKFLAGLIDSDGYVDKRGSIGITLKSKKLIEDIVEVTRSLGGFARISKKRKGIKSTGFVGTYYHTQINLGKNTKRLPLLNKFKKDRLKLNPRQTNTGFRVKKREGAMVYGFELDSESHLYITDNYAVTHNSVLAQQIACYWHYAIEEAHGIEVPFEVKDNIVFHGGELIKKGNKLGEKHKFGCLIFDEAGADLEGIKVMKKTTQAVKDYLRECGQYNMLTILVLPEFFDLPKGIAMSRSDALIDCYVTSGKDDLWERGHFSYFSRPNKKKLYRIGKKELNYQAANPDFRGDWDNVYTVDEEEYRESKKKALKTREIVSAKEERQMSYLKGCLKILIDDLDLGHREIARRIASKQKIRASHTQIGRILAGERDSEDED